MRTIFALAVLLCGTCAQAHEQWTNGAPIPSWIKQSCCGKSDAHHLRPDQVHHSEDGYYYVSGVEGFPDTYRLIDRLILPSEDGDYWLFFRLGFNGLPYVYCFFAPLDF